MKYVFKRPKDIGQFDVRVIETDIYKIPKAIEDIKEILEKNKIDIVKEQWSSVAYNEEYFFNRKSFIITMMVICAPVGLILMYAFTKLSVKLKIIISIIVMTIDIVALCLLVHFLKSLY